MAYAPFKFRKIVVAFEGAIGYTGFGNGWYSLSTPAAFLMAVRLAAFLMPR